MRHFGSHMSEFCLGTDHEHPWAMTFLGLIMSHHQVFSKASKSDYHFGKLMVWLPLYHQHGIHTIIFLVKQHGMDTTTWSVDKSPLRGSNRRARQAWGRPSSVDGGSGWTIRTSFDRRAHFHSDFHFGSFLCRLVLRLLRLVWRLAFLF